MAGKKGGDNGKKVAGQARKAQAAANKTAAEDAKKAAVEDADWDRGAKNNAKKEQQAAKKAEQAKKKAEKDALFAEEEKSLPSRAGPKNSKTAVKKTNRGLDNALSELDGNKDPRALESSKTLHDDLFKTWDAEIEGKSGFKVDRHVDRRVGAAYKAFVERRLAEMKEDGSGQGLRLSTKKERLKDEFKNSSENPIHNQVNVKHNASKAEVAEAEAQEKARLEALYISK